MGFSLRDALKLGTAALDAVEGVVDGVQAAGAVLDGEATPDEANEHPLIAGARRVVRAKDAGVEKAAVPVAGAVVAAAPFLKKS